jgi:hypothetical protein
VWLFWNAEILRELRCSCAVSPDRMTELGHNVLPAPESLNRQGAKDAKRTLNR